MNKMTEEDARRMVGELLCLFDDKQFLDHYQKDQYDACFARMGEAMKPLFTYLGQQWDEGREGYESLCGELAEALVSALPKLAERAGVVDKKRAYQDFVNQKRSVMALYILPLLLMQRRDWADRLHEAFSVRWNSTYPEMPLMKTTYEEIMQGFRKKPFGCYITSAVCEAMNHDDNCYELSAFRQFRDTWLLAQPDGQELVDEYYRTAPKIVDAINAREDGEQIYCQIWEHFLLPCLEEIEDGQYEACKKRYVDMVRRLEEEFL